MIAGVSALAFVLLLTTSLDESEVATQDRSKTAAELVGFYQPLLTRLKALPGVVEAT